MSNNKKIVELVKSKGVIFPTTVDSVEEFESKNNINNEQPQDWDNPVEIIRRGILKLDHLNILNSSSLDEEIDNLKMVARKGNNLQQHIIDKMKAKHKKDNDK
ncbi:MAG: hypothetical protein E2604_09845 [Flavobacterium sp.]|nr:hypothetical protein [Flavobacterium sp.]